MTEQADQSSQLRALPAIEGIDWRSLEYTEGALQEQLLCPICCLVLTDPTSSTCGHTFCKECIQNALSTAKDQELTFKCPIDRHPLPSKSDLLPAAFLVSSLLNELEVFCPFKLRGCPYKDKKWTVENHVTKECEYVLVKCNRLGEDGTACQELAQRRHVLASDGCVHLSIQCPNLCGDSFPKYQLQDHLDQNCMNVMVKCPDCLKKLPQPELSDHFTVCPEKLISCTAEKFGCLWTGRRVEFIDHSNDCQYVKLLPVLTRQEQRMDALERENSTLRFHVERLTNQTSLQAVLRDSEDDENPRPSKSQFSDSDLLHMFMESERLRQDIDRLGKTLGEMEAKQSMMIMRENCRTGEEIANLRSGFNGLRHQLYFLLAERRSGGAVAASNAATSYKQNDGTSSNGMDAKRQLSEFIRDVKL